MNCLRNRLYLATISDDAASLAREHRLGLELDDFCTAANMDADFDHWDTRTRSFLAHSDRFILHAPFAELHPCAIDPLVRGIAIQRFRQAAKLCERYSIKRMVVHTGFVPNVYFPVWFVEQSAIFFREFLSECPADFRIMIENVMDPDPQPIFDMVCAIGDERAGICLDVGHANAVSKLPIQQWLRVLSPKLTHLHVHDNDGSWDTHSIPGDGNLGFPGLFDDLFAAAPDATITCECIDAAGCVRRLSEYGLL